MSDSVWTANNIFRKETEDQIEIDQQNGKLVLPKKICLSRRIKLIRLRMNSNLNILIDVE